MAFKTLLTLSALVSTALSAPLLGKRTNVGYIASPSAYDDLTAGSTFAFELADYPCPALSFFKVLLIDEAGDVTTLQDGLGGNGDCSPAQYHITLPTWASGSYTLAVDEFLWNADHTQVTDSNDGPYIPITVTPPSVKLAARTYFGDLTSPTFDSTFAPGATVDLILENYPASMCQFNVIISSPWDSKVIQQGLGPNGNLSPVEYHITLPDASSGFTSGTFTLSIDEFLRVGGEGTKCVESGNGPSVDIVIS